MTINAENATPKYLQLKEILLGYFDNEHYQRDQKIPSESELMGRFDVSRGTVRQTLAELVNEGIIYKKQGSGSFFAGTASLTRPASYLIGVIVPRLSFYIYPQIIQGIDDVARQKRYNIVLGSSNVNPTEESACLEQLLHKRIDGLLIEMSGGILDFENSLNFQRLLTLPIPVVFMDWMIRHPNISFVSLDDIEGGFRATNYLIEQGHQRIACVSPFDTLPGIQRNQGYRNALAAAQLPYDAQLDKQISIKQWNEPDTLAKLIRDVLTLAESVRPTAIFFFNDDGAIQSATAIRQMGLKIPDDISIMGFDDSPVASVAEVPLTTMSHPKFQLGKWAAELLFDQIEHQGRNTPRQMILHPGIMLRQSVKTLTSSGSAA